MRTKLTSRLSLLFVSFALMLALPAMALADVISNNLDNSVDATAETLNLTAGSGANGNVSFFVAEKENDDGKSGCNLTGNTKLVADVVNSDASVATVSASSVEFTSCGDVKQITVTPLKAGQTTISLKQSFNNTGGTFKLAPATFNVIVAAAAPTQKDTSLNVSSASGTYSGATDLSATLSSSSTGVSGKSVDFSLNGASVGSATTNDSGVAKLTGVSLSGINAGTHAGAVVANFAGDTGHKASLGSGNLNVSKAATTTTVNCNAGALTFDGSAQEPCSASVSGAGGLDQPLTVDYQDNTNAGQATASASFAGSANHLGSSDSKNFQIAKADAVIDVQGFSGTYDGTAKGASGTATGADGSNLNSLLDLGARFTDVPGGDAAWSFAGDTNHKSASGSVAISIDKANQSIDFGALADKNFGDQNFAVSATGGASGNPVSFSAVGECSVNQNGVVSITGAGGCTITASQAGNGNYNAAQSVSQSFQIAKALAQVSLSDLAHDYDGSAKAATATTAPAGLQVNLEYTDNETGLPVASPTNVGSYEVSARIDDANYRGNTTGTLKISAWTHKGFTAPVDMGIWNTVKAGSTVPMKFEVFKGATELKSVSDIKSASHKSVGCGTLGTSTADAIEVTTTGSTSLRFDTTSDQFIFNWKTGSAWTNCYVVTVVTQDGTPLNSYFKMR